MTVRTTLCRRGRNALAAWCGLLLAATAAHAPAVRAESDIVYRWVDAQGQVHYSDDAPHHASAQAIKPAPPLPSGDDSARRLREFVDRSDAEAAAKGRQAEAARQAAAHAAAGEQACVQARANRARVGSRPRILQIEPDGSARRLTEEERQARLAELDQIIAGCGSP